MSVPSVRHPDTSTSSWASRLPGAKGLVTRLVGAGIGRHRVP